MGKKHKVYNKFIIFRYKVKYQKKAYQQHYRTQPIPTDTMTIYKRFGYDSIGLINVYIRRSVARILWSSTIRRTLKKPL